MAQNNKIDITTLPYTENTDGFYTVGTSGIFEQFDYTKSYEIGDLAEYSSRKVMFKKHHVAGTPWDGTNEVVDSSVQTSSVKVDMSFASEGMENIEDSSKEPELFSQEKNYVKNDVVKYESRYYMFKQSHGGAWDASHVKEVNFLFSLSDREMFSNVEVEIKCTDVGFPKNDILVVAKSTDGSKTVKKTTDATGKCKMRLSRDKKWLIFGKEKDGRECEIGKGLTPNMWYNGEKVELWYVEKPKDKVELTIKATFDNYTIPASSINVCAMSKNGGNSIAGITDSNGCFSGYVDKNDSYSVYFQNLSYLNNPFNLMTSTVTDRNKTVEADYDSGVYFVCGETAASLNDGTAWKEFKIDEFPIDPASEWEIPAGGTRPHPKDHPCVLVHVATNELKSVTFDHSSMELLPATDIEKRATAHNQIFNYDRKYDASYYIRVQDLTSERSGDVTQGRQWCTQNYLHKHVTTDITTKAASSYDGPLMTSFIDYDSGNELLNGTSPVAATSPAAEYAMAQEFDLGSRKLHGFIGTYMQMDPLFKLSTPIYGALAKFGYLANYKTGTYWWSCTQKSKTDTIIFRLESYTQISKNYIHSVVIPFFT